MIEGLGNPPMQLVNRSFGSLVLTLKAMPFQGENLDRNVNLLFTP